MDARAAELNSFEWDESVLAGAAHKNGTPLYVYDLARLRNRVVQLRSAFAEMPCHLYFATMANDQPSFLGALAGLGVGACVNSIPHLRLALESGFEPQRIQFTSTGISVEDMRTLHSMGITANLDSMQQLEGWFKTGGVAGGVRINAGSLGAVGTVDRIGIAASEIDHAIALARAQGGRIDGLHIYVGTNFQTHAQMMPTLAAFFELAAKVKGLKYLNLGGGIGVDYGHSGADFDVRCFGNEVARLAHGLNKSRAEPVRIIIEPGRGIAATCGVFVTKVTDVKVLNGTRYVAVDGSVAIFPRPFHHPDSPHRIRLLNGENRRSPDGPAVVVGRTTFSRDILGMAALPALHPGDFLVVDDAGAYSQSMMSRFLGQPVPDSIYFDFGSG